MAQPYYKYSEPADCWEREGYNPTVSLLTVLSGKLLKQLLHALPSPLEARG